jgi:hypothetical protein
MVSSKKNNGSHFMRKELAKQNGERKKFTAIFERLGKKTGYQGYAEETILLKNIFDVALNKVVADHVWFNFTKGFQDAMLTEGAWIEFEARVKEYSKGYVNSAYKINNKKTDYKLSNPTKIKIIKHETKS